MSNGSDGEMRQLEDALMQSQTANAELAGEFSKERACLLGEMNRLHEQVQQLQTKQSELETL